MEVKTTNREEVNTVIPEALHGEIIELTPATITTLVNSTNVNSVGMIVMSDELKRAHDSIMPYDERGKKVLARLPDNTAVVLKRVDNVQGRYVFVP